MPYKVTHLLLPTTPSTTTWQTTSAKRAAPPLQHPYRVSHLVLVDPWGFPTEKANGNIPFWLKPFKFLTGLFTPLSALRLSERLGWFT
jgi:hypothetical protein